MIASRKKSTRRGITPIIAVILLLLMTVAAAGAAFLWITKFQGLVSQQMNKQLGSEQRCEGIKLSIDQVWIEGGASPDDVKFTLRNAGSINLKPVDWMKITVTGGVTGKSTSVANCLNGTGGTAGCAGICDATITNTSNWNSGDTYQVTCSGWAGDVAPEIEENDVYAVTAQPDCGTPATNSAVFTIA